MQPLDTMDRLCDHMLDAWYVPVLTKTRIEKDKKGNDKTVIVDDFTLLDNLMAYTEAEFEEKFPEPAGGGVPEGEIGEDYYKEVEAVFAVFKQKAQDLAFYDAKCRVLMFKSYYDYHTNTYEVFDIDLRPCVWETGIIRKLTDAGINGLRTATVEGKGVSMRFRCKTGSSYIVSITMEDEPKMFKNETSMLSTEYVFSIPYGNYDAWDQFYKNSLEDIYKNGWLPTKLKSDEARFNSVKKKFRELGYVKRKFIESTIKAKNNAKK